MHSQQSFVSAMCVSMQCPGTHPLTHLHLVGSTVGHVTPELVRLVLTARTGTRISNGVPPTCRHRDKYSYLYSIINARFTLVFVSMLTTHSHTHTPIHSPALVGSTMGHTTPRLVHLVPTARAATSLRVRIQFTPGL